MSRRTDQLGDLVQSLLAELIARRLKHPALTGPIISITRVAVSPDLASARVWVSVLGSEEEREAALEALAHSESFLHRQLASQLHTRRIPRLDFHEDRSMAEAERLSGVMHELARAEGREP